MYPRNAASPERIAIGAVVQISDGAVQGSGVTITVRGQGGAEGAGGGTTAFGATGVIVYYTPLQAETDFTSFVVIASKSGCIPVAVTVITSTSATPGNAGIDWGKVINQATAVNLSATNIDVDQVVASVSGAVGSVTTVSDKTGYRLSATGVDDVFDEVVEGTTTLRQSVRLSNSALGGKASGLATTNAKYRDLADSKDRIDATVDADGNRTAVTTDLT